ncbi:carbon storage regulator [Thioalkalivibrio sp. ALJ24]|uniref:carbon storage regulator n=1 Tax=Thioalkalivibrio sp. ALJ24 TaxID=545276 RepID=UPI00068873C3|nr:carbon storage regulator [Thioalkalivibrio sp. ALJ24]
MVSAPGYVSTEDPVGKLRIGDDIRVSVLGTSGECIRVGIDAPGDVPVHREEVFERLHGIGDAGLVTGH